MIGLIFHWYYTIVPDRIFITYSNASEGHYVNDKNEGRYMVFIGTFEHPPTRKELINPFQVKYKGEIIFTLTDEYWIANAVAQLLKQP